MRTVDTESRVILHCDCNNFYASVELLSHPELRDKPVAVAGDTDMRHGIILAKNMPAKKFGIKTAETVWQARKKCPDLVLLPPHHGLYSEYSRKINQLYLQYTDQVEPFSVDESWLDVTASRRLFGNGVEIADKLRRQIRESFGITISAGVSFNKTWAKMGSDYKKPDATTEINRQNAETILYPLPVDHMIFVGQSSASLLRSHGITTIGDIVAYGEHGLTQLLGKSGASLYLAAAGLDTSPVRRWNEQDDAKSISHSETFPRDLVGPGEWEKGLLHLSEKVGARLRAEHLKCCTVTVQIKDPSLRVISRQVSMPSPTASTDRIYRTACELVREHWEESHSIRLLCVQADRLIPEDKEQPVQLSMLDTPVEDDPRRLKLEKTVDMLRQRFGSDSIVRGLDKTNLGSR